MLRERFAYLWEITRWGWFVIYELGWALFYLNIDFLIGKYGSEPTNTIWDRITHPHWSWKNWLIGALAIILLLLLEGAYRLNSKQERNSQAQISLLEQKIEAFPKPKILLRYVNQRGFGVSSVLNNMLYENGGWAGSAKRPHRAGQE
jgi:hypothetical protein